MLLVASACQPLTSDGPPLVEEPMPGVLASTVCAVSTGNHYPPCCGPDDKDRPFEAAIDCRESGVTDYISSSAESAQDAGLSYDGYCAHDLTSVNLNTCHDLASGTFLPCKEDCQLYYGNLTEGDTCVAYGHRMSDCQQGLICAPDRTCHQPCDYSFVAPEDGYCGPGRGMWLVTCAAGLTCTDDGFCRPAGAVGETCDVDLACAVGGWCDENTGTCVESLGATAPCSDHEQCVSNVCKAGRCFAPASPVCGRWAW